MLGVLFGVLVGVVVLFAALAAALITAAAAAVSLVEFLRLLSLFVTSASTSSLVSPVFLFLPSLSSFSFNLLRSSCFFISALF